MAPVSTTRLSRRHRHRSRTAFKRASKLHKVQSRPASTPSLATPSSSLTSRSSPIACLVSGALALYVAFAAFAVWSFAGGSPVGGLLVSYPLFMAIFKAAHRTLFPPTPSYRIRAILKKSATLANGWRAQSFVRMSFGWRELSFGEIKKDDWVISDAVAAGIGGSVKASSGRVGQLELRTPGRIVERGLHLPSALTAWLLCLLVVATAEYRASRLVSLAPNLLTAFIATLYASVFLPTSPPASHNPTGHPPGSLPPPPALASALKQILSCLECWKLVWRNFEREVPAETQWSGSRRDLLYHRWLAMLCGDDLRGPLERLWSSVEGAGAVEVEDAQAKLEEELSRMTSRVRTLEGILGSRCEVSIAHPAGAVFVFDIWSQARVADLRRRLERRLKQPAGFSAAFRLTGNRVDLHDCEKLCTVRKPGARLNLVPRLCGGAEPSFKPTSHASTSSSDIPRSANPRAPSPRTPSLRAPPPAPHIHTSPSVTSHHIISAPTMRSSPSSAPSSATSTSPVSSSEKAASSTPSFAASIAPPLAPRSPTNEPGGDNVAEDSEAGPPPEALSYEAYRSRGEVVVLLDPRTSSPKVLSDSEHIYFSAVKKQLEAEFCFLRSDKIRDILIRYPYYTRAREEILRRIGDTTLEGQYERSRTKRKASPIPHCAELREEMHVCWEASTNVMDTAYKRQRYHLFTGTHFPPPLPPLPAPSLSKQPSQGSSARQSPSPPPPPPRKPVYLHTAGMTRIPASSMVAPSRVSKQRDVGSSGSATSRASTAGSVFPAGAGSSAGAGSTAPGVRKARTLSKAPLPAVPFKTAPFSTSSTAPSSTAPSSTTPSSTSPFSTAPSSTSPSSTAPSSTSPASTKPSKTSRLTVKMLPPRPVGAPNKERSRAKKGAQELETAHKKLRDRNKKDLGNSHFWFPSFPAFRLLAPYLVDWVMDADGSLPQYRSRLDDDLLADPQLHLFRYVYLWTSRKTIDAADEELALMRGYAGVARERGFSNSWDAAIKAKERRVFAAPEAGQTYVEEVEYVGWGAGNLYGVNTQCRAIAHLFSNSSMFGLKLEVLGALQRRSPSQVEVYQTFVVELSELPHSLEVAMGMETLVAVASGSCAFAGGANVASCGMVNLLLSMSTFLRHFDPWTRLDRLSFASGPASLVFMARDKGNRTGSQTTGELLDRLEASKRWSSGVGEEEEEKELTEQQKLARIRRDMARESEKNDRAKDLDSVGCLSIVSIEDDQVCSVLRRETSAFVTPVAAAARLAASSSAAASSLSASTSPLASTSLPSSPGLPSPTSLPSPAPSSTSEPASASTSASASHEMDWEAEFVPTCKRRIAAVLEMEAEEEEEGADVQRERSEGTGYGVCAACCRIDRSTLWTQVVGGVEFNYFQHPGKTLGLGCRHHVRLGWGGAFFPGGKDQAAARERARQASAVFKLAVVRFEGEELYGAMLHWYKALRKDLCGIEHVVSSFQRHLRVNNNIFGLNIQATELLRIITDYDSCAAFGQRLASQLGNVVHTSSDSSDTSYQTYVRGNSLGDVVAHLEDQWAQQRPRIPFKKRTRLG